MNVLEVFIPATEFNRMLIFEEDHYPFSYCE